MELRYGAMKRGNPSDFWQMIEQHILSKVRILNFSYTEALKAGELTHQLYSMGQPIGIEDIMIGSIALCNDLTMEPLAKVFFVVRQAHHERKN
jgi:predicted nucleic acid-binding protein